METKLNTLPLILLALDEDKVNEDITTLSLSRFSKNVTAEAMAKESGVVSGLTAFNQTFLYLDSNLVINIYKADGDQVKPGDIIAEVKGNEASILRAERTALNFLQRLSGIATLTADYVKILSPTPVKLLDTRKTTPGMRQLEKQAVRHGGGTNHRMDLAEMAMIKDNHILMAGSITAAVQAVRQKYPLKRIEVEVKTIHELQETLPLNVDWIMLDNFNKSDLKEAIALKPETVKFEVSGNVSKENILEKAIAGIDYISCGALTHSFKSLDISLNIRRNHE
jgi:nicotinate-nucleotide pyrophosphorylase (carboxylating)